MEDVATRHDREVETKTDRYDQDFYGWTMRQSALLRAGRVAEIDLMNVAEEIEGLGRAEYHALRSSFRIVIMHLLKMRYQPTHRSDSWTNTIVRERNKIEDALLDNPGLRPRRIEAFAKAYPGARREAASETKLELGRFPLACPFSLDEVESHDYWP